MVRCPSLLPISSMYASGIVMLGQLLRNFFTAWRSNSWGLEDLSFFSADNGYCELAAAAAVCRRAVGAGFVLNRDQGGKREASRVSVECGCSERRSVHTPGAYCPAAAITLPSLCRLILQRIRIKNNLPPFPPRSAHQ